MKFRASRLALLEAFNIAGSIVSQRPTRPVLANIHLVVSSQGTAELRSTDQDTSIRFTVALEEGAESGEALLPAARVSSILKECGTDDVAFESDESGKVRIRSGRSRFQVLSENPAEFPDLPEFNEAASFGLEREKLHLLMSKTQFAIAKEKSRFAFNGARLDIEGNLARMIATDGKRLAMKTTPIDNSDGVTASPIVPARALTVFDRVFNAEDDIVRVALGEHQIMIKTARAEVSSVLVEGNFPNYKAVIPAETTVNIRFPREELMRAFRQASLLTSQETRSVRMKVASGKAVLTA